SGACAKLAVGGLRSELRPRSHKAHPHACAPSVGAAADAECRAVHTRNLIDDGQSEAAADPRGARQPVETLAYPPSLGFRDARAIILHFEVRRRPLQTVAHGAAPAARRVLESIVDQILQ